MEELVRIKDELSSSCEEDIKKRCRLKAFPKKHLIVQPLFNKFNLLKK